MGIVSKVRGLQTDIGSRDNSRFPENTGGPVILSGPIGRIGREPTIRVLFHVSSASAAAQARCWWPCSLRRIAIWIAAPGPAGPQARANFGDVRTEPRTVTGFRGSGTLFMGPGRMSGGDGVEIDAFSNVRALCPSIGHCGRTGACVAFYGGEDCRIPCCPGIQIEQLT